MKTDDKVRELLVEAVMESDGGPSTEDERWDAEVIADDLMRTYSWSQLVKVICDEAVPA